MITGYLFGLLLHIGAIYKGIICILKTSDSTLRTLMGLGIFISLVFIGLGVSEIWSASLTPKPVSLMHMLFLLYDWLGAIFAFGVYAVLYNRLIKKGK